ncbi:MAG: hypothetical protein ABWZ16_07750 [Microbacterium sp.]
MSAAALAGVLLLAGCSVPSPTSSEESPRPAAHAKSPSPTPEAASVERLELSFGGAEDLVEPHWAIGWADPFILDERFTVLEADDGNGSWSYTDLATTCEIHFYQGEVTDLDWSQDDRVVSDEMLAILAAGRPTDEERAQVAANAGDWAIPLESADGAVDLRVIGGAFPDGSTVANGTRMFGALSGGVTVSLLCPAGRDASSEFAPLADGFLRVSVTK